MDKGNHTPEALYTLCLDLVARGRVRTTGSTRLAYTHHGDIHARRLLLLNNELKERVEVSDGSYQEGWLQKLTPDQKWFHSTDYDWDCIENYCVFCELCGRYMPGPRTLEKDPSSNMVRYKDISPVCDRCC